MKHNGVSLKNEQDIVNAFAAHFRTSFTDQSTLSTNVVCSNKNYLGNFLITEEMVEQQLRKLKGRLTTGVDNLPEFLIKDANHIPTPLYII